MNPDRLQTFLPKTDPAAARRPCGCRAEPPRKGRSWAKSRGAHQDGCPLAGIVDYLRWLLGDGPALLDVARAIDRLALRALVLDCAARSRPQGLAAVRSFRAAAHARLSAKGAP